MDARIHVEELLALRRGDAHIIRNAGGLATDDALRSIVVSSQLLGTRELAIVEHTGCGLLGLDEEAARREIARRTGHDAAGLALHAFRDLESNVRAQVDRMIASPFLPEDFQVSGWILDIGSGRLREVAVAKVRRAAGSR
jgi:carbonic anhydrase